MRKSVLFSVFLFVVALLFGNFALANELFVGTKDGFASVTEAVKAAKAGDTIFIATGVYQEPVETYPIEINLPVSLIGDSGVVLKGPPYKPLLRVTSPDVSIENVDFHLLRWGIVNTGDRLSLMDCRFTLSDAKHRISSSGVWLAGVYDCHIANCEFVGCGICIAGPPISEQSEGLPVLTGLFEVGEDVALFTSHTLINNRINNKPLYYFANEADLTVPLDAGGLIAAGCANITVQGVDVSDNSMGIQMIYCSDARIVDVTADRCGIFGVYVAKSDRPVLQGVSCTESNHGVDLRAVQSGFVTECETLRCEQGIFLSFATDCIVDSCSVTGGGNGLFIASGAQNQLSGNTIEGSSNGLYCQGERDVLVCGNTFLNNSAAGLRLLRSSGQVLTNSFLENWVGTMVAESGPITIWNNRFESNQCTGLYLRDVFSGKVSFNTFENTGLADLEMEGSLIDTLVLE